MSGYQVSRLYRPLTPITFILSTVSDKDPSAKLLFYSLASVLKLTVSRHVRETDSW